MKYLDLAENHADKSDLCIVLGSSLTVSPACDIPRKVVKNGGKLVIVNLQKTPLDDISSIRIFGECDMFTTLLMKKLNCSIPEWNLERFVMISHNYNTATKRGRIRMRGMDDIGTPYTLCPNVDFKVMDGNSKSTKPYFKRSYNEPFGIDVQSIENATEVRVRMNFIGHYKEPTLIIPYIVDTTRKACERKYKISYNFKKQEWRVDEVQ